MKKMKLYNHQKIALQFLRIHNSYGLFMEQGCGKTLPVLRIALERLRNGEIGNMLIVAPIATMGAWTRDLELFEPGERKELESIMTVINYESVWRRKEYDKAWDLIVLDESHKIKNRTAKCSKFLLKLALKSKYRYILTGTPIGNGKIEEIWSQLAFLDPVKGKRTIESKHLGSYYTFLDNHCYLNKYYTPYKYRDVHIIQDIIGSKSYRVTKEEALDLPNKLPDEIYEVELADKKTYKQIMKGGIAEHDLLIESPVVKLGKCRQVASGFVNTDTDTLELKCNKIPLLKELLESREKKTVIFAEFKHSIKSISELLIKMKIKYIILDGQQKDKNAWRKFQSDDSIKVIICQYRSASQGVDLFASDMIVYFEPTLSSNLLEQSRDRIHRIGQNHKCSYIHFITKGTVERAIYRALSNYKDFNEKMFEEYIDTYDKGNRV